MLERLGRHMARHHWWVLGAWLIVALALSVLSARFGGVTRDDFTIPGTPAQRAIDLLQRDFPEATGGSATVVFQSPQGKVTDPANAAAIGQTISKLQAIPNTAPILNPLAANSPAAANVSADQTVTYVTVQFTVPTTELPKSIMSELYAAAAPAEGAGVNVQFGGAVVDTFNAPQSAISEHADDIGLAFAVVILLISLGAAVAMLVPIGTALFSLGVSSALIVLLERWFAIGFVAPILGTMLGLGVGIDYSLFVVSRYRQNLAEGMDPDEAVGRALGTAGSAVLFAGLTVCLAMAALGIMGIPYVRTLGLTAALYVVVTVMAALTFLPALLGLLGRRINRAPLPWHQRTLAPAGDEATRTLSARWAHQMARRPWLFAPLSLLLLLVLASPLMRIDLGFPTDASAPADTTQRKAYDLLTDAFGPGANGPLLVVGALPPITADNRQQVLQAVEGLVQKIEQTSGVDRVVPGANSLQDPTLALVEVIPTTGPDDPATADLVRTLRATTVPDALQGTVLDAAQFDVGGSTAELIDLTDRIEQRMALLIAVVLGGSFLLLMMVFRSLFVPFKAAIMNLLSIGAAYGVLVAMFEWGWGKGAIGLEQTVVIAAFVPVMMFAILFGLSMDYEVFLLSRIREEYLRTGDSHDSIVVGLSNTARVITSAALIMIAVFLAFVTNPSPLVKMIGLGLAVAVFVDATIVRMVLVPSTMELMGKANWWLPHWLDGVLPHLNVDQPAPAPEPEPVPRSEPVATGR